MNHAYEMVRRRPGPRLRGIVTELVFYRETVPGRIDMRERAGLVVPLVIGFAAPFAIGIGGAPQAGDAHVSFVAGLAPSHVEITSAGQSCCLQINFTPMGARAVLGRPMNELAGVLLDPGGVFGGAFDQLRERLGNEASVPNMLDLAERFLVSRLAGVRPRDARTLWAYDRLVKARGTLGVGQLAELADVSRKHLNRLFLDAVGLAPKAVSRIVRFEAAVSLASASSKPDWSGIAAECGFADQAHLIREFRALSGSTPLHLVGAVQ